MHWFHAEDAVAKKRVVTRRQRRTKKAKPVARTKARVKAKSAAPKRSAGKALRAKVKAKPSARKPSKPLPPPPSEANSAPAVSPDPKPQAFWDPQGGHAEFTGDSKAHTKPEDQRAHIRMTSPRTWSNRQRGRG